MNICFISCQAFIQPFESSLTAVPILKSISTKSNISTNIYLLGKNVLKSWSDYNYLTWLRYSVTIYGNANMLQTLYFLALDSSYKAHTKYMYGKYYQFRLLKSHVLRIFFLFFLISFIDVIQHCNLVFGVWCNFVN